MNCRDWEERVALYAEGDLTQAEMQAAERHLAGCTACREFLAELKQSLAALRAAHAEPLEASAFTLVRTRVLEQIDRAGGPVRWLGWIGALAAAAAVLLILLLPRPVPKPIIVKAPPLQVAAGPPAPVISPAAKPVSRRKRRSAPRPQLRQPEPLVVKLVTDDPDVVIYWIAN